MSIHLNFERVRDKLHAVGNGVHEIRYHIRVDRLRVRVDDHFPGGFVRLFGVKSTSLGEVEVALFVTLDSIGFAHRL